MHQVANLRYSGGETNTPQGLSVAIQELLDDGAGSRAAYPDTIVILTDGYTTDTWQPNVMDQVNALRANNIYVVGRSP